jgi:hypothetical protein
MEFPRPAGGHDSTRLGPQVERLIGAGISGADDLVVKEHAGREPWIGVVPTSPYPFPSIEQKSQVLQGFVASRWQALVTTAVNREPINADSV